MLNNILKYKEHENGGLSKSDTECLLKDSYSYLFPKKKNDGLCYCIRKHDDNYNLELSYFIGLDWLDRDKSAIYVESKLNVIDEKESKTYEIDYVKMLFSSLNNTEVRDDIKELFLVKWDEPTIEIEQKQDLLTPFLVAEFLSVLKTIVRKGLKKSYYRVEENLNSRVKGKVMIAKSIKHNLMRNKNLYTFCNYEVFGLDNKENRLLKKALVFVKRYLPNYLEYSNKDSNQPNYLQNTLNYISPAFDEVSDDIELNEIKHTKMNSFYKEYAEATRLAKLILKRFGYNISNTSQQKVNTPPFWIDMSKLFEVYVLGLLKERFFKDVKYQYSPDRCNELDFLLNTKDYKMVIDAKYKLRYLKGKHEEDIRQISGYARLNSVYEELGIDKSKLIDCLVIYPDMENGVDRIGDDVDLKSENNKIKQYSQVYKLGVKLPIISK